MRQRILEALRNFRYDQIKTTFIRDKSGLVARIEAELGTPVTVISTGGLAPLFVGATPVIRHHDPEITMRGLVAIHRHNRRFPR